LREAIRMMALCLKEEIRRDKAQERADDHRARARRRR